MDVASFSFGDVDLERFIHHYEKSVPETVERQRRVARKWLLNRDSLRQRMNWPRELMREWQLEKASMLVDVAYNTIPFYRDRYHACGFRTGDIVTWDDFAALPITSRIDLAENFPAAHVLPGIVPDHCYGARTSGSSGIPMTIVRDDGSEELQTLLRLRQFEVMLGGHLDPNRWIYNVYVSSWAFTSFDGKLPVFSVSERCPAEVVVRHLKRLRPQILSVFPSFLGRMLSAPVNLSEYGVRCICTNSEGSSRQERINFSHAFGVPVFDEYSTEELCGVVASECIHGNYHIVEDRIVVETANEDVDGIGDIIGTDLANFYMPVIRYSQGDLIRIAGDDMTCQCGNNFRHFDRFCGRADQALTSPTTGRVGVDRLMNLCDRTFVKLESGVASFRIVQKTLDSVDVLLSLRPGLLAVDPGILSSFTSGLRELFEFPVGVNAKYFATLPDTKSHKRRMVVNEMQTQPQRTV